MVVLEKLEAENFRRLNIPHTNPLIFPEGVVVIKGPNEAGKSTIIEAILYALFGKLMRGDKELAINHNSQNAYIKLTFKVGGEKYEVERIIRRDKATTAKLYNILPNNQRKLVASSPTRVNTTIKKLIGEISFNELLTTNIVAQKELDRILNIPKQDREKVVNALIGLESYNKAIQRLQEERKGRNIELSKIIDILNEKNIRLKQYLESKKEIEYKSSQLKEMQSNLKEVGGKLEGVKKLYELLEKYKEALTKRSGIETELAGLRNLKQQIAKNTEEIKNQIAEKTGLKEKIIKEAIPEKLKEINRVRNDLKTLPDINSLKEKYNQISREIAKIRLSITRLTPSIILIALSLVLLSNFPQALILLILGLIYGVMEYVRISKRRSEASQRLIKVKDSLSEVEKRKIELEGEIKFIETNHSNLIKQVETLGEEIAELERKVEEKQKDLEKCCEDIKIKEDERDAVVFPELPNGVKYSDEEYNKVKEDYQKLIQEKAKIEGIIGSLSKRIEELDSYIKENEGIEGEVQKLEEEMKDLELNVKSLDEAIQGMRQVSKVIREGFAPSVEQYMSEIISYITNGRYKAVKLDEDYKLSVFDSEAGRFIPRDIYSGGTVDQFLLSMRLAFILSLLPQTKGAYPKFLFLDEPLGSSDINRRSNIIELLTETLRKYFNQIILITHIEDVEPEGTTKITIENGEITEIQL